jgi:hypothetical protein
MIFWECGGLAAAFTTYKITPFSPIRTTEAVTLAFLRLHSALQKRELVSRTPKIIVRSFRNL